MGQVGMPVPTTRRGADGDEYSVGAPHRLSQRGGKCQPPLLEVRADDIAEPGLEDWNFACVQTRNLRAILIHARDLVAEIRNTSARNEAHVASADYRNPHACYSPHQPQKAAATSLPSPLQRIKMKCYAWPNNVISMSHLLEQNEVPGGQSAANRVDGLFGSRFRARFVSRGDQVCWHALSVSRRRSDRPTALLGGSHALWGSKRGTRRHECRHVALGQ